MAYIIDSYNSYGIPIKEYLDTFDEINKYPSIEVFTTEILVGYSKYLEYIKINNVIETFDYLHTNNKFNILLTIFDNLTQIINKIINIYINYDITIKNNNIMINDILIHYIYKTSIILFEYHYYIKELNNKPIQDYIKVKELSINVSDIKLYEIIVKAYNQEILNIRDYSILDEDNIIKKLPILNIFYNTKLKQLSLSSNNNNPQYRYIKIIELLLKTFNELKLQINLINTLITIPQYYSVCWYISMLTCICYSDGSKNLILNNIKNNKIPLNTTQKESDIVFKEFVKFVIKNIKNYSSDIKLDCEIFKRFKKEQYLYLAKKYEELYTEGQLKKDDLKSFIGTTTHYYNLLYSNNIQYNPENHNNINKLVLDNKLGNYIFGYDMLIVLYKTLGISSTFYYDIDSKFYKQIFPENIETPDIIFITKINEHSYSTILMSDYINEFNNKDKFNEITKNEELLFEENKEIITFNGNKYKLDYMLHVTDEITTCENCAHCISGIHYNKEQYYYDSRHTRMKLIDCDEEINIPCSIIKQQWKTNEDIHYCIEKCFYKAVNIHDNYFTEKNFGANLCFNIKSNYILAYVKIIDEIELTPDIRSKLEPEITDIKTGGKKLSYKITKEKIIFNYNNKKIMRNIYINKLNHKFIKLNNKFIKIK